MASTRNSRSSSRDSNVLCEWGLPSDASKCSNENLQSIGICYRKEAAFSISDILHLKHKNLKKKCMVDDLPLIAKKIIELTKRIFTFSLTLDVPVNHFRNEVSKSWCALNNIVSDFQKQNLELLTDELNLSVLFKWKAHAQEFLLYLNTFSKRWDNLDTRKGSFTQMLIHFLRMCLMVPEMGNTTSRNIVIRCDCVSSTPDIQFLQLPDPVLGFTDKVLNVVTVAECKEKVYKGSFTTKDFSAKNLSDRVLGKHGVQLLAEYKSSLFRPCAIGIICIQTEIIFTCLEMDTEHFLAIQNEDFDEDEVDEMKGDISYSRPYNFLDATDRAEILEACFWLGYVQTNCYTSI